MLYEAYQGRDWARAEACLHPAAELEVRAAAEVFHMAAFWDARDGLLASGTEYWVDPGGSPPPWRAG